MSYKMFCGSPMSYNYFLIYFLDFSFSITLSLITRKTMDVVSKYKIMHKSKLKNLAILVFQ